MDSRFDQLLNAYWLRPETALWRYIDIRSMAGFEFTSPSLDFGCGDGMFSFIRSGGEFAPTFDVFKATANLDKFFEQHDVYDAFDPSISPTVTTHPGYRIDVAFDHKQNLLKKAATLGLYEEFKVGDGNKPLPFKDESFSTIFSNIVYWLDDPARVLMELHRILKPGGRVCLMLPDAALLEFSFYNSLYVKTGDQKWAFLEKLDRGRLANDIKQAKSGAQWEKLFDGSGLRVHRHSRHLSKPVVQLWDIGMRPLFPVLMKMIDSIDPEKLPEIKEQWISIFKQFLEPLIDVDRIYAEQDAAFHCYILERGRS
jgi:SAM-dependent methyltransferase